MPTAIDLFCGCGGLSLGFQNAGFTILRAFDIWEEILWRLIDSLLIFGVR